MAVSSLRWGIGLGLPLLLAVLLFGVHHAFSLQARQRTVRVTPWKPATATMTGGPGASVVPIQRRQVETAALLPSVPEAPTPSGAVDWTQIRKARRQRARQYSASLPATPPPRDHSDSIFVSVASYRDPECQPTILDMFTKAKEPTALFVGAVEQHMRDGETVCMPPEFLTEECQLRHFCPSDNIEVRHIHPRFSRGPTFGRYIGALMWRGEKYYMMIDSHNRFVSHWDAVAVAMHKGLIADGYPKPVLSHYPEPWNNPADGRGGNAPLDNRDTTSFTCTATFVDHLGYIRFDGYVVRRSKKPRNQPWAAAGFLFADASVLQEVPFDPHLHFVFDGEEVLYSVRLWTHGYDIFSPNQNILYHYYYRPKAKKFWSLLPPDYHHRQNAAHRRIQRYLQTVAKGTNRRMVPDDDKDPVVTADQEKYGLGTNRTLAAWYDFAGVDKVNYKVEKKYCSRV